MRDFFHLALFTLFLFAVFLLPSLSVAQSNSQASAGAKETSLATFAGGCFWCVEAAFDKLEGVLLTTSGYSGGSKKNPSYREVSAGKTKHAEVVEVRFDPAKVSYQKLLDVFWRNIDPTQADGQFCDRGAQYRSAIFYHSEKQKELALRSKKKLEVEKFKRPLQTQVLPLTEFYPAERYHQDYHKRNPARYQRYYLGCGRGRRLKELWGEG